MNVVLTLPPLSLYFLKIAYAYVPADPRSEFCRNSEVICNDQYGKSIGRGQIYFQPGTWTRLDIVMELNEPAGTSNGTLQVYQNGNLAVSMSDIPYRTSGMVGFQGLMFSSFFGGSDPSYATPVDTRIFFRNVEMSVGPPAKLYEGTGNDAATNSISTTNILFMAFAMLFLLTFECDYDLQEVY